MWNFNKRSLEATSCALLLFSKAVELDPDFLVSFRSKHCAFTLALHWKR
jgi:hypothetical protein